MSAVEPREKRFAEAVVVLVEAIQHDVPTARSHIPTTLELCVPTSKNT